MKFSPGTSRRIRRVVAEWLALAALSGPAFGVWTTQDIQVVLAEFPEGTSHLHQMMPMRDGVRLSTHLFLPAGFATGSYPVVLLRSAYNYWPQRATYANDVVTKWADGSLRWSNTNGFVYVMQDLRGDGDSERQADFEPRLSDNEIADTYDTVESLATNRWCNGRVGMYGSSGHGMAAYMGWFSKAPHLVVVAPNNTAPNLFEHWSFENGVRRWSYRWLKYRTPGEREMPEWPKPTLGNYYPRDRWRTLLREGAAGNKTVLIAGDTWHNLFLNSAIEVFSALTSENRAFLTIEPGTHQGVAETNGLSFPKKTTAARTVVPPNFFQVLDGVSFTNPPTLKYFVMGDARRPNAAGNFFRIATAWPPLNVPTDYFFHQDGSLTTQPPGAEDSALRYAYDPKDPAPTVGGHFSFGLKDSSGALNHLCPELMERRDILRFVSAPFERATEIAGPMVATLHISSDVPDSTFVVRLLDIYPHEGTNEEYHAIMRESAMMVRYAGGFDRPAPLKPGQVYRLDIRIPDIAWLVETNHRVAVHITSSSRPAFEVHPNTYDPVMSFADSPVAHHTLHVSVDHPSFIRLPLAADNPR